MTDYDELLNKVARDVSDVYHTGTYDAVRLSVLKGGLRIDVALGWPDDADDEDDE